MGLSLSLIGAGAVQAHKTVQLLANLSIPPLSPRWALSGAVTALCIQTRIHLPAQLSSTFSKKALWGQLVDHVQFVSLELVFVRGAATEAHQPACI